MLASNFIAYLNKVGSFIEIIDRCNIKGCRWLERNIHTLENSQIVSHCNNGIKESCRLAMFHSFIRLLLVQVERFDILWDNIPIICTNDSKTLINILIENSVLNKVVVYRSRWILMNQLPLAVHTFTDHFKQIKLKYVELVWTYIWPTLFLVVIDIVAMNARTY